MSTLKVGDICITVNSNHPAINNGVLMVIVGINPDCKSFRGESTPYLIRRVDGQVMGSTFCVKTGAQQWGKHYESQCAGHKLQRIDDQEGIEGLNVQLEMTS